MTNTDRLDPLHARLRRAQRTTRWLRRAVVGMLVVVALATAALWLTSR